MKVLITGGAGFVGSNLAIRFKTEFQDYHVISLDNLKRRGSELAINRLRSASVEFIHGDIRNPEDLKQVGSVDIVLECSAEPSVQAGYDGDSRYLVNTNLGGTINCLEFAVKSNAAVVFLSTSRVYPIAAMRSLPMNEIGNRLEIQDGESGTGWSAKGINTNFPMKGSRSLYGTTKLCSELLIQEYAEMYNMPAIINRCGVITGPWQMGKVDQGFVTLWAARHFFGGSLQYIGFGGRGLQVRDILHVDDLFDLIQLQIKNIQEFRGDVFNVGGGPECSLSLLELTDICQKMSGNQIDIGNFPDTHPADIPYYVSDNTEVFSLTGWRPKRSVEVIMKDIFSWLNENKESLRNLLS